MATVRRSAFDIWWDFTSPYSDFVCRHCGSADEEILCRKLPVQDWELYIAGYVTATAANCGSLSDAIGRNPGHAETLRNAFTRFGCPATAALVPECIKAQEDWDAGEGWAAQGEDESDDDYEERIEAVFEALDDRSDFTYTAAIRYLVDHQESYLFPIGPFCGMEEGDTLELTN